MYIQLVELFEAKRQVALLMRDMGWGTHAQTETLPLIGFATQALHQKSISLTEYQSIRRLVNAFCDSLLS